MCAMRESGSTQSVARLARLTAAYYVGSTLLAIALGIVLVLVIQPGRGAAFDKVAAAGGCHAAEADKVAQHAQHAKGEGSVDALLQVARLVVPDNLVGAAADMNVLGALFVEVGVFVHVLLPGLYCRGGWGWGGFLICVWCKGFLPVFIFPCCCGCRRRRLLAGTCLGGCLIVFSCIVCDTKNHPTTKSPYPTHNNLPCRHHHLFPPPWLGPLLPGATSCGGGGGGARPQRSGGEDGDSSAVGVAPGESTIHLAVKRFGG